eukprot:SAG31_NODE_1047_length_10174_cov_3.130819_2_plen_2371_part_00
MFAHKPCVVNSAFALCARAGDRVLCPVRSVTGTQATPEFRIMLLDELEMAFFCSTGAPVFAKVKEVLAPGKKTSDVLTNTEFLHICSVVSMVAAGCQSRWHYYSPLNEVDTLFFVKCLLVALIVRSGRTQRPEEYLSETALKIDKRLAPNNLCMTTILSNLSMCLHHLDAIMQMKSLLHAKSSGSDAAPDVDMEWKDSCDGRLTHAILNIAVAQFEKDHTFDPFTLIVADEHTAKLEPIAALPWSELFAVNWAGNIAKHVPTDEVANLATMNDMQLDIWNRELVMDPDGDVNAGEATSGENPDDDQGDADDDDDKDADEDDEPEDEEEEEKADNTTMEEEGWGDDDEGNFEAVTLAAPSDTNFLQLRQLDLESEPTSIEWPSVLLEDRWGDEVEGALVTSGANAVTSIDEAYKALEPPTIGTESNEITNRMSTVMRVPEGAWRKHLGIKSTAGNEDEEEEEAEITLELSKKWAEIAESVPPMPRKDAQDFKNGILTTVSTSTGSNDATYKAESSWRPPQRRQRKNFSAQYKPETFTFQGKYLERAEAGCKFSVILTPHPTGQTIKLVVYGSLDVTALPPKKPAMVEKRDGADDDEDSTGLAALTAMDRQRAKVDGIYDTLLARAKAMQGSHGYAVTTNERTQKRVERWEEHYMAAKTPWPAHGFQKDAFSMIRRQKSVLVTAPTGAGKTEVAMCAVNQALLDDERLIFICPTKALVNQTVLTILAYFQEFPDWQKKKPADRLCGFNYMDEFGKVNTDAKIVVTVPQTLHLMLKSHDNKALENVGWIVLDEVHHIQEEGQGVSWDWIFRLLDRDSCKFVALSATLANNQYFAKWLHSFRSADFVYKPETYKSRMELGAVAASHGSHIEVFPNGRPVKQQVFLYDRDFTKLPRASIIDKDDEILPFNIALSQHEDVKQVAHIKHEVKPGILYDQRAIREAIAQPAAEDNQVLNKQRAVDQAPGAASALEETPTQLWDDLRSAAAALVKEMYSQGTGVANKQATVLGKLTKTDVLLTGFLHSHMKATPGWEMTARANAAVDNIAVSLACVYLLGEGNLDSASIVETHELTWRCLVTHRAFRGMLPRVLRRALDVATVSTIFSHFLEWTLKVLEGALGSLNSTFDEPMIRTPKWADDEEEDEGEDEPDIYTTDKTLSPLHLMRAMPLGHTRMIVKSIGDLLCETFIDVRTQTDVLVTTCTKCLAGAAGPDCKNAIVYLCMDALGRFSEPPDSLMEVAKTCLTQCVDAVSVGSIAEAISVGSLEIHAFLAPLLESDIASYITPADADSVQADACRRQRKMAMSAKLVRLKRPDTGRAIERLLALAVYADLFDEKSGATIRKQLMRLAAVDEDEEDDDEDDEEEKLNKACMIMYLTLFTRTTLGSNQAEIVANPETANAIKDSTQDALDNLLEVAMAGAPETKELLVDAVRHVLSFLSGPQLITIGENKKLVFSLLPGLESPWPVISRSSEPSAALVSAVQYLLNAIPHEVGKTLKVDGVFGPKTEARIKALQKDQVMPETGEIDEMTWFCLVAPLPGGAKGLPVMALRALLPHVDPVKTGSDAMISKGAKDTATENEPEVEAADDFDDMQPIGMGLVSAPTGDFDPDDPIIKFDSALKKELHRMCKAVGGWLIPPSTVAEKEWNHLIIRALYANWDGSAEGKEYNTSMRIRLKKAQLLFRAGLGIPLVGETKARLLWILKTAYEGAPSFSGKQWYVTRYRMAKTFGLLESDWELDAFSVSLTPFKTFREDISKPRERLPDPQQIAVELLQNRAAANTNFDRRAFEKLVYDIPLRVQDQVAPDMQLLVALNIIGAFAKDGSFVLPPHVVLTMVEVLSDFPAPTQKKVQKVVQAKCDELTTEWNSMKINPYVLNTLEGEVRVILKKLAQVKAGAKAAKPNVSDDAYFVRNWLFSTKPMPQLVARFIPVKDKLKGKHYNQALIRILKLLSHLTAAGQQISRQVLSCCYYLISAADRILRIPGVLADLEEDTVESARNVHTTWCQNTKLSQPLRVFLVIVFRVYKKLVKGQLKNQVDDLISYDEAHSYLHFHATEALYDLRCLHMHEITGLQHYRELVTDLRKKKLLPALLFCLDRKKVEKIARHLAFQAGLVEMSETSKAAIAKVLPELAFSEPMGKSLGLFDMLRRGIGVHHADLSSQWRMEIESLFRNRHLQIVVATGTLAVGIHMPCKTVVFCGDNAKHLSVASFQQMAGRAGRQGIKMGGSETVINEPELDNQSVYKEEGQLAEVGTVVLFGAFSQERTHHLMTAPAKFEEQHFFDTGSVLSLIDLSNPRMEGTNGYKRGTEAINTRSAYEFLQLEKEASRVPAGIKFDPYDSNVARLKQQQLRAAFQNLRMMGMLDKNFDPSLAVAVVQVLLA